MTPSISSFWSGVFILFLSARAQSLGTPFWWQSNTLQRQLIWQKGISASMKLVKLLSWCWAYGLVMKDCLMPNPSTKFANCLIGSSGCTAITSQIVWQWVSHSIGVSCAAYLSSCLNFHDQEGRIFYPNPVRFASWLLKHRLQIEWPMELWFNIRGSFWSAKRLPWTV